MREIVFSATAADSLRTSHAALSLQSHPGPAYAYPYGLGARPPLEAWSEQRKTRMLQARTQGTLNGLEVVRD